MAMCNNNCFNFVAPFLDESCVGNNLLHTKLVVADISSSKMHYVKIQHTCGQETIDNDSFPPGLRTN